MNNTHVLKVASAIQEQHNLITYVPEEGVDLVKKYGLLSSEAVLKNPEVLEFMAKNRGQTVEELTKEIEEGLASWRHESYKGPSVLFNPIPEDVDLPDNHPTKQRKLVPLKINIQKLIAKYPELLIRGSELVPYDEAEYNKDPDGFIDKRRRQLTLEDVVRYIDTDSKELWKDYGEDDGAGRYAPNVPHAQVITPEGYIDPELIEEVK